MLKEKWILSLTAFLFLWAFSHQSAFASNTAWQCVVFDKYNEAWQNDGKTRVQAINNALSSCRNASIRPKSCQPDGAECIQRTLYGNNAWACRAVDKFGDIWVKLHDNRQTAINNAWRACHRQSAQASSCRVAKTLCEPVNSVRSKVMWQCLAFDRSDRHWARKSPSGRANAMRKAKEACENRSAFPRSCFSLPRDCKVITR